MLKWDRSQDACINQTAHWYKSENNEKEKWGFIILLSCYFVHLLLLQIPKELSKP